MQHFQCIKYDLTDIRKSAQPTPVTFLSSHICFMVTLYPPTLFIIYQITFIKYSELCYTTNTVPTLFWYQPTVTLDYAGSFRHTLMRLSSNKHRNSGAKCVSDFAADVACIGITCHDRCLMAAKSHLPIRFYPENLCSLPFILNTVTSYLSNWSYW